MRRPWWDQRRSWSETEAQVEVVAWVEVQAGTESGHLVEEWVENEIQVQPGSLLEAVFGASLADVLVGLLFGAFVEVWVVFLVEVVFGG